MGTDIVRLVTRCLQSSLPQLKGRARVHHSKTQVGLHLAQGCDCGMVCCRSVTCGLKVSQPLSSSGIVKLGTSNLLAGDLLFAFVQALRFMLGHP